MSQLTLASRLKPEIRLAQAVSLYEADLSADQKARFRADKSRLRDAPPSIRDVMRLTAEIDQTASGKTRCLGPRMVNVLQPVQQFAALGGHHHRRFAESHCLWSLDIGSDVSA